ncbi:PREDICTED: thyroid receptor-interacting protein 11-like isoform X2 [Dinoponera quadriceps]|uniref:Thyroid receptor-interacting protein 11-like isoform X2 n=1 Tax=Dinoponera quadriceps TaxID=609295 RepID=A0A6P3Y0E2_DINQU|nr:PREDICTED: thyroid receptor-interacting protein 11-like isoform X2 [Dinoponera quadriceps]
MAWFGDGLASLSNLKGQITNYAQNVLSEGIVEEMDERSRALKEANERCTQLEDLLNSKDAEISLLRRQNHELQIAVVEINEKSKESKDTNHIDEASEGAFWDPSCDNNRNARNQNHVRQLQEQLVQATVKVNNTSMKDDLPDGHRRAEVLRAKQDMLNRIIQIEEKTREAERNAKRIQLDETTLVNDFRSIISKLNSHEKFDLVSGALKALQIESDTRGKMKEHEKSDSDEKFGRVGGFEYNPLTLRQYFDANSEQPSKPSDTNEEHSTQKEEILRKRIEELENKNEDLLQAMEKLDEGHSQSIEELLALRQEANKKHRTLQSAYEQLSVDYNEAQREIIELRSNDTQLQKLDRSIDKLDKHTQATPPSQKDDSVPARSDLDDVTEKVKAILRNCTINSVESGESIFETLAKQYVDSKWKLEMLERKLTETARNFKDAEDVKDALQMDCEELQSHIDTLLMENQTLKSSLPCIPEASEERVASLETDVESLNEEVKRLLAENKTMRETNSNLTRAIRSQELSSTNSSQSTENADHQVPRSCLEEDKESWEEIGLSKDTAEREEFPIPSSEVKSSDEEIERPRVDHENVTQELVQTVSKVELLESDLALQRDTVNKLARENEDLLKKKAQLEMELYDQREHNLRRNDYYECVLGDLQQQLNEADREKSALQDDLSCRTMKLDKMQTQIDGKQSQLAKLCQDNDRLTKENVSLSEQLAATHNESLDKIELLNTEMSLLQQEHEDLKQEVSTYKEDLARAREELRETQQRHAELGNERGALKARCEELEEEKQKFRDAVAERARRVRELEEELNLREAKFHFLLNKCESLEREAKGSTMLLVPPETTHDERQMNDEEAVRAEKQRDSAAEDASNAASEEQRTLEQIIEGERREKEIARELNEKLTGEIAELHARLQTAVENNKESAGMAKQTIEDLSRLIRDKDNEMSVLRADLAQAGDTIAKMSGDIAMIDQRRDGLEQLAAVKHNEVLRYQDEIQQLVRRVNEQAAHIQGLIAERTVNEAAGKANTEENGPNGAKNQIAERQRNELAALDEKCGVLEAALIEERSNSRILRDQLAESQGKEINAARELERLRTHLVEMESSYTEEALIAEKTREELETKLQQVEEKMKNSLTAYTSASIRANQQVETLQQQMALIVQQRDQIQAKLSATEDNILVQAASLTNLQIVLEQFQQTKERDIISATEKIRSQLNESYERQQELASEISTLKQQLSEAKECLQAASRLSEQLEKKDEQIGQLNEEVTRLTALVSSINEKVRETMERDEGKVDKTLVKNLLLGYLSPTTSDKSSILRVFATVLDFTESEKDKTGVNNAAAQGNWMLRAGKGGALLKGEETSLSAAFVRFLESESKPKPQLPALPILNTATSRPGYTKQQQSTLASSSSASSSLSSSTLSSTSSSSSSSLSTQSTLLLSNVALPTFPDFVPARNTGSILKEVLKDS